ncbi:MAG: VOC family protein [Planctomycetota bacterium]|jgi:hypothetical protein|nr:VOC family protein [Planctomycetota bacterium]
MFKNGAIMQLGQVVLDIDRQMETLNRDFGIGPFDVHLFDDRKVKDSMLRCKPSNHVYLCAAAWVGGAQFELMQPLEGKSIYDEHLADHRGEGLQHIKIYYDDVKREVAAYERKGYPVKQSGGIGDDLFYYLDTESKAHGVTIEIGNAGSVPPPDRVYPPGASSPEYVKRPLRDGDLMQIGHVVADLEDAMDVFYRDFGIGPFDVFTFTRERHINPMVRGKPGNHTFACACAWCGDVQYELMQPLTGRSVYNEFLEKHGEGLHHLKLYFKDVERAVGDYAAKGYGVIQSGGIGEDRYFYLDTEEKCAGLIIELGNNGDVGGSDYVYPAK